MRRRSSAIAVLGVVAAGGLGCGEMPSDVESKTAAIVGVPIGAVRGFTRNDGVEGVVYKGIDSTQDGAQNYVVEAEVTIGHQPTYHKVSSQTVSNSPWGYKRSDNVNAIMYLSSTDNHVHEVTQSGTSGVWSDADFSSALGLPAGTPETVFAYIRTDGLNSILYNSSSGHIIEIYSNFGGSPGWLWGDLTGTFGAPTILDSPMAYIRSDNKNAIVYRASDGHIHEMASNFGGTPGWIDTDLFVSSGLSLTAHNDPWGYKRADNINAVVFTENGNLYELYIPASGLCSPGHVWCADVLATDATTNPNYRPSAYVRWDNINAVMYRSATNTANEMSLPVGGSTWLESVLPVSSISGGLDSLASTSVLFGHRAPGLINSVLFEGMEGASTETFDLYLPNGGTWGLQVLDR